jgi:hypothetical protein
LLTKEGLEERNASSCSTLPNAYRADILKNRKSEIKHGDLRRRYSPTGGRRMAGGYTHITVVQAAAAEVRQRSDLLHDEARMALSRWLKYTIIGAVGPDYPYLDIADRSSEQWATVMHTSSSLEVIRECVRLIRPMSDELIRQKCMAWLFGFASHCVTDGTVHPVVNLKVGPYEQNKTAHRRCEMAQDVLVNAKLNLGPIALNEQLSHTVAQTSDGSDCFRLDRDIARLWQAALNTVYRSGQPPESALTKLGWLADKLRQWRGAPVARPLPAPDPDEWHRAMWRIMKLAENGGPLIPVARHATANAGLTYPATPDPQYILRLQVPEPSGERMDFEDIYTKAISHIVKFWGYLSLALQGRPSPLDTMAGWSLDNGLDQNNNYVFWSKP